VSRVVLVPGATGDTGRAVCTLLTQRGDTVIAVGTDPSRLEGVDAAERLVADLTDPDAAAALAQDVRSRHDAVDGILHLIGGWKPGWGDEVTDWLNARLVHSLRHVSEAFEGMLRAAPVGRLAIVSSTVVTHDGPPTSAYAAAKLGAEAWVAQLNSRWAGTPTGAVTFVVRSIGDAANATPTETLADALAGVWDRAPGDRVEL
jgi:NAD(P)-dependent dehydrogenase (short-subunit alcohol dehydrogenase family)